MKIQEYHIETAKSIPDTTFAILSDLHIDQYMEINQLNRVLYALEGVKPNHILVPGDLYNVDAFDSGMVFYFLENASDIAPIYYQKGNAELKKKSLPTRLFHNENSNIHILGERYASYTSGMRNYQIDSMIQTKEFNITGINFNSDFYQMDENSKMRMLFFKYKNYIEKISKQCGPDQFNILLCHDPIIIEAYSLLQNMDLVISGHNHGGLFPDSMKPLFERLQVDVDRLYPTYINGNRKRGKTDFIVSEGVTKFHSESGILRFLEKMHEGTIEVVYVKKK